MAGAFTIENSTADQWQKFRDLRLEMLQDTPLAYLERLSDAERVEEPQWRARAARDPERFVQRVAVSAAGEWIGTMGGHAPTDGSGPWLVAVFVSPRWRGRRHGVADALLTEVEVWAAERSTRLMLEVNEKTPRARAFYAARGFVETGQTRPYPLDAKLRELEMLKRL